MTRASRINVKYMGKLACDPKDSLSNRASQRNSSKRRATMICRTVGELIAELQKLPVDAVPISLEPPWEGVRVYHQPNGKVLLGRPLADGETWSYKQNQRVA